MCLRCLRQVLATTTCMVAGSRLMPISRRLRVSVTGCSSRWIMVDLLTAAASTALALGAIHHRVASLRRTVGPAAARRVEVTLDLLAGQFAGEINGVRTFLTKTDQVTYQEEISGEGTSGSRFSVSSWLPFWCLVISFLRCQLQSLI